MRKLVLSLHTSLDGYIAGKNGNMNWIKIDEEIFDLVKTLTDRSDIAIYSRKTWQMMDNYWPLAGNQANASKHDKDHSEWYNKVEKIVLSDSMKNIKKEKTTFVSGDIILKINDLKQKEGKDIIIFGSPTAAHLFIANKLIDEYWLFINPVILGEGFPLFPVMKNKIDLGLNECKIFKCGVTGLHYSSIK